MNAPAAPIELRCEYFTNPLGLDTHRPRLSWWVSDPRPNAMQSAYQLLASSSLEKLSQDCGDLWDSGKVATDQSIHVEYAGPKLQSRQRVYWKVRTWDAAGSASPFSAPAWFEMGFLDQSDWKGSWIAAPIVGGPYTIPPAAYLRREFGVNGQIASARLYVTALGIHDCEINNRRVSDHAFMPGRTDYRKRVPYHVHDVASLLNFGDNCIDVILGDGWYCGHLHSDPRQTYGDRPRLLAQLEITMSDGSMQTIVTDEKWSAREGPIRSSDMLMGEDYDARITHPAPGTQAVGREEGSSTKVIVPGPPTEPRIVAHRAPPVRPMNEIKPIAPPTVSANRRRHIFDMGQNMVGRVRLRIRSAAPGKTIDLRFAEMLDKDGKPYTTALRTARSTDHYTTRGGGEEIFESRFTFHGFRYVEVRDYPGGNPGVDDLTGIVLHSDCPSTGTFECSDPLVNQLQSNIVWSQKGNFLDFPTDCPQRDERLGWTGDAQVFIRTAAFNMDVANFFTKWLTDVADAQGEDGRIPSVVPNVTSIYGEGGPAWADACVICPWTVYLCYGDKRIIEDCWPTMTRFMQFLKNTCPNHIRADETCKWRGYGDWLSHDAYTPPDLIGTAFYAHCANLMSRMAAALDRNGDASSFSALRDQVKRAWQNRYVTPDGMVIGQTQTAYVLALHFDLIPQALRPKVVDALVRDIKKRGMHLSTGFVGTPYLNHVLTDNGQADIAFALLMQKTCPGWLFPVTLGATTMWERWDGWTPEKGFNDAGMNSYNHYAYGAVGEWLYAAVAGIDLDRQAPGYKHIIIRPHIPSAELRARGGGLTHARATLKSPYGLIESGWRIDADQVKLSVTIPPNTTATVHVPNDQTFTVGAGRHEFVTKLHART